MSSSSLNLFANLQKSCSCDGWCTADMKALYLSAVLLFLVTPLFRYSSTPPVASDSPFQVQFNPSCCFCRWWHPFHVHFNTCCSWWLHFSVIAQTLLLLVTPLFKYSSTPPGLFQSLFCWWSLLLSAVFPPAAVDAPAQVHKSILLLATPLLRFSYPLLLLVPLLCRLFQPLSRAG